MRPTTAGSAEEALKALRTAAAAGEPFPLVLLDAMMPGMDGFALAEKIKENADLAGAVLRTVTTPTLLIVGGQDPEVIRLNEQALAQMSAADIKELAIVPGATHLFEEPGTLEQVARLARDWFLLYLDHPGS